MALCLYCCYYYTHTHTRICVEMTVFLVAFVVGFSLPTLHPSVFVYFAEVSGSVVTSCCWLICCCWLLACCCLFANCWGAEETNDLSHHTSVAVGPTPFRVPQTNKWIWHPKHTNIHTHRKKQTNKRIGRNKNSERWWSWQLAIGITMLSKFHTSRGARQLSLFGVFLN